MTLQMAHTERRMDVIWVRAVFECDNCSELSVASHFTYSLQDEGKESIDRVFQYGGGTWVPEHVEGKQIEDVPEHIASLADEAYRCGSIKARRGAILVARAALEATTKDRGANGANLLQRIDALVTAGDLEKRIGQAAHAVRGLGADMAHGDVKIDVEDDDVADALEIMSAVLENVYQLPARVSGVLSRREARKRAAKESATKDEGR